MLHMWGIGLMIFAGVAASFACGWIISTRQKQRPKKSVTMLKPLDRSVDLQTVILQPPQFHIQPGNAQHVGRRQEQQDAFGFSDFNDISVVQTAGIFVTLADGMGGLAKGSEASNLAVKVMLQQYAAHSENESVPQALLRSLQAANEAVCQLAVQSNMEYNIGTTLMTAVIREDQLYWISVGDSRIYLYREGYLTQLTEDHNYARKLQEEVIQGKLTREEALTHPERNTLTSYLGIPKVEEVDQNWTSYPLRHGDVIMLCSDGLHGTLSEQEMVSCFAGHSDIQLLTEMLVHKVLSKNSDNQDNVTVAMLAYK